MTNKAEIGIIGLGVMGKSLALNFAEKGISVAAYNRNVPGEEEGIAESFVKENDQFEIAGFDDLKEFIDALAIPRKILVMIKAGDAISILLENLRPLIDEGDIIMDGGNSYFKDTNRRDIVMAEKGMRFLGIGVSGGEEGARKGPSIMPGGDESAYKKVEPFLTKIAAKDKDGLPCCTYIGKGGAGHFVKMVHNGIEYAEMQLIVESYFLLKNYAGKDESEISDIFSNWNNNGTGSFLLEITIDILKKRENGEFLLSKILDAAEQKGTGWWSAAAAMEMNLPFSIITEAVMARNISAQKEKRVKLAELYDLKIEEIQVAPEYEDQLLEAYQLARIMNHAVGFDFISNADELFGSKFNLSEIARIWTNGCIIRSKLMEELVAILKFTDSILEHPEMVSHIKKGYNTLATTVGEGVKHHIALPVFTAALNYFIAITTASSPANLIQAQRDYFGAHTYRRTDQPLDQYFHTEW